MLRARMVAEERLGSLAPRCTSARRPIRTRRQIGVVHRVEDPALHRLQAVANVGKSAVRDENGKKIVFLMKDDKAERRAVTLGADRGSDTEVIAGVTAGDTLIVKGPENLRDGQNVEIKK